MVRVPHGMAWCVGGQSMVAAEGRTLKEVWDRLHRAYPELMWRLSLEQGPPSSWVRILVDGTNVTPADWFFESELPDGVEIALHIVPAVVPGSGTGP